MKGRESPTDAALLFDVQVYGPRHPDRHAGVMAAYKVRGESAQSVAASEAERWSWHGQATTVGVWADDRKSGHAQAAVFHA